QELLRRRNRNHRRMPRPLWYRASPERLPSASGRAQRSGRRARSLLPRNLQRRSCMLDHPAGVHFRESLSPAYALLSAFPGVVPQMASSASAGNSLRRSWLILNTLGENVVNAGIRTGTTQRSDPPVSSQATAEHLGKPVRIERACHDFILDSIRRQSPDAGETARTACQFLEIAQPEYRPGQVVRPGDDKLCAAVQYSSRETLCSGLIIKDEITSRFAANQLNRLNMHGFGGCWGQRAW